MKKLLLILIGIIQINVLRAAPVNKDKLDSLFNVLYSNKRFMGSVAISKDGNMLYSTTKGFRDSTSKGVIYPDQNTKYRIGSITKMFTATIVLQLIEEGRLTFGTKLSDFYPSLPYASSVSIEQLLTHHTGYLRAGKNKEEDKLDAAATKEDYIAILSKFPFDTASLNKGAYSNVNYVLLGFIIETLTSSSLNTQISERICKPLGLKNTYNQQDYLSAQRNEAHSFHLSKGKWVEDYEWHANTPNAAGYMVSTSADLLIFADALFQKKIISATSLAKMTTIRDRFGMGIMDNSYFDKKAYGHSGRVEGFVTALSYYPEERIGIVILFNGYNYDLNELLILLNKEVFHEDYTIPDLQIKSLSDKELEIYEGDYKSIYNYKVSFKKQKNGLKASIKQEGGLLKQKFYLEPLSKNEFISLENGTTAKFSKGADGNLNVRLRIQGASLDFIKTK